MGEFNYNQFIEDELQDLVVKMVIKITTVKIKRSLTLFVALSYKLQVVHMIVIIARCSKNLKG